MTRPFLLAQLSDLHVGADWATPDPAARLAAVVESARLLEPDVVLVSGDLADHAADAEYELVRDLLAPLAAPVYVATGNHDERRALRRHFGIAGDDENAPVRYAADVGLLRLVVLDTAVRGEDPGALDEEQRAWLDAELAREPELPTLLAMHHPPFATGLASWDRVGLPPDARRSLAEIVARHPQVKRLVCGHLHHSIDGQLGGRPALVAPSTYVQARLSFDSTRVELTDEPPAFAVHALVGGDVVSYVQSA